MARLSSPRIVHPEQEIVQAFDVVLDDHLHVDDVQVAANHQGFGGKGIAGAGLVAAETQFHAAGFGHPHHIPVAHRGGPPPLQALLGYRRALHRAKETPGGVFAGADGINASAGPRR